MKEKVKYGATCAVLLVIWIGLEVLDLIWNYLFYSDVIDCIKMFIESLAK